MYNIEEKIIMFLNIEPDLKTGDLYKNVFLELVYLSPNEYIINLLQPNNNYNYSFIFYDYRLQNGVLRLNLKDIYKNFDAKNCKDNLYLCLSFLSLDIEVKLALFYSKLALKGQSIPKEYYEYHKMISKYKNQINVL